MHIEIHNYRAINNVPFERKLNWIKPDGGANIFSEGAGEFVKILPRVKLLYATNIKTLTIIIITSRICGRAVRLMRSPRIRGAAVRGISKLKRSGTGSRRDNEEERFNYEYYIIVYYNGGRARAALTHLKGTFEHETVRSYVARRPPPECPLRACVWENRERHDIYVSSKHCRRYTVWHL